MSERAREEKMTLQTHAHENIQSYKRTMKFALSCEPPTIVPVVGSYVALTSSWMAMLPFMGNQSAAVKDSEEAAALTSRYR